MLQRFLKDESGMALALAVITVVLVGVMGAGLLVFVNTDLNSVVEGNRGQKAFNLADAGVQTAKAHLQSDAYYLNYNGVTNSSATPPDPADSDWSCGTWNPTTKTCSAAGKTLNTLDSDGNIVKVWIQYLKPSSTASQANDSTGVYAPEVLPTGQVTYPSDRDYFKVISEAAVGQARRKVEAIYYSYNLTDVPRTFFTPGNITVAGSTVIRNISLFSLGNVTFAGGAQITGKDVTYGKWASAPDPFNSGYSPPYAPSYPNTYNSTARTVDDAGIGAAGTVSGGGGGGIKTAGRDYDSATCPKFVKSLSESSACASSAKITFPFNPNSQPDLSELRSAALGQPGGYGVNGSNYYEVTSNAVDMRASTISSAPVRWPAKSGPSTVVYVKFNNPSTSNVLNWSLDGPNCGLSTPVEGILVVENGTVKVSPNSTPLKGVIIIRGAGVGTEVYSDIGTTCMQAFVNATGDIKLAGSASPSALEKGARPGFSGLKLWSWRELYQ